MSYPTSEQEKISQRYQIKDLRQVQVKLAALQGASLMAIDICQNIETQLLQLAQLVRELQSKELI